jgi:hypothetical protein
MSLEIDFSAKDAKNISVLKRVVPSIKNIIESNAHVAIYKFDPKETKWDRFNVEGSLFLIHCNEAPYYQLVVLNKEFPEDFILDISTINKMKIQTPYLMIRYSTSQAPIILGLWFHGDIGRDHMHMSIITAMKLCQPPQDSSLQHLNDNISKINMNQVNKLNEVSVPNTNVIGNKTSNGNILTDGDILNNLINTSIKINSTQPFDNKLKTPFKNMSKQSKINQKLNTIATNTTTNTTYSTHSWSYLNEKWNVGLFSEFVK